MNSLPGRPPRGFEALAHRLLLLAQYHEFRSAVQDLDYGSEFDAYAYMPLRDGFYAQAKYANYQADDFFTDVQKVIFGLGYQY